MVSNIGGVNQQVFIEDLIRMYILKQGPEMSLKNIVQN